MAYSASFTAGGIYSNEFEALLPFILSGDVKEVLEREVKENKYLKVNTESARQRMVTEIKKRLKVVDHEFWVYYKSCNAEERKLLLLYQVLKTYQLAWDFHFKITVPGFWAYRNEVDNYAYKMYLDELGSKRDDVHKWSETTKTKCITTFARMLRDSGMVKNEKIQKPGVDNDFYCYFIKRNETWALDIFLLSNPDKETLIKFCQ